MTSLTVTVVQGRNLVARDANGLSDPFCSLQMGKNKYKTKIQERTLNPFWDEVFTFHALDKKAVLRIKVMDHDKFSANDFMGKLEIPASFMTPGKRVQNWHALQGRNKKDQITGDLDLILEYITPDHPIIEKDKPGKKPLQPDGVVSSVADDEDVYEDSDNEEEKLLPGQNNRTEEMRKVGGIKEAPKAKTQPFMPDWFRQIDGIRPHLRTLEKTMERLRTLHSDYLDVGAPEKRKEITTQITGIMDVATKEAAEVGKRFKKLESELKEAEKKKVNDVQLNIKRNMFNTITKRFVDLMNEYNEITRKHETTTKEEIARQYAIVKGPNASKEEIDAAIQEHNEGIFQQALQTTSISQKERLEKAKEALQYVKTKHKEILKLERSLIELQQLFVDMAFLVASQRDFINRIEDNIATTLVNIKTGTMELKKAKYYQRHRFKLAPVSAAKLLR